MIALKSTKGQVELFETLMVIVIVVIVLVVALGFYLRFSSKEVSDTGESLCMTSSTVLLVSIASMPEIECSVNGNTQDCIDTSKLMVFDPAREYGDYFETICKQKVSFVNVYPEKEDVICTMGNYPDCTTFDFYGEDSDARVVISTPVSLYYPLTGEYTAGKLVVEVLE